MLNYKIIPITGHPPHTHGIEVVAPETVYDKLQIVFGRIEFLGVNRDGYGVLDFDYTILSDQTLLPSKEILDKEMSQILDKILLESTSTSDVEERAKEIQEEEARLKDIPQDTTITNADGSITEIEEIPTTDGGEIEMVRIQ